MKKQRETTFIFSCSAVTKESRPTENLYMWGHYGNGHRGIAIEFDALKTITLMPHDPQYESNKHISSDKAWIQIKYKSKMELISERMMFDFFRSLEEGKEESSDFAEYLREQPRSKSTVWRTENEWRIYWRNEETKTKIWRVKIPSDAITGVYIGLAASTNVVNDILFDVKQKCASTSVYLAKKSLGFSEIKFDQIA